MSENIFQKTIEMGENDRPHWLKRIVSLLVDTVLLFFGAFLIYNLFSLTPLANNLHRYQADMQEIQDQAKLDSGYGYESVIAQGEEGSYLLHYNEEGDYYYIVKNVANPSKELTASYKEILSSNSAYSDIAFSYNLNNYGLVLFAGFLDELIILFLVPLCSKRRATPGQLLCGIRLISTKRMNVAAWYQLAGRLLFTFGVESAIPYLILSQYTVIVMPILVCLVIFFNKDNRSFADFVCFTKAIEAKTFAPLVDEE